MTKGIKARDIRDFEKYAKKLNEVITRIRAYSPEAHIYATPGQFNLMSEYDKPGLSIDDEEDLIVTNIFVNALEVGDW